MIIAYSTVLLLSALVMAGAIPSLVGEASFTLLLGVSAFKLYRLARKSQNLPWQRGVVAMALAATIITLHNLAWVYGGLMGEVPLALEFVGASLYTLQVVPWAFALSVALFIVYDRIRGALYLEILTHLIGIVAAVVFMIAVSLGLVLGAELGIAIADGAGLYLSAALLVPAIALWFSRKDVNLTRPFLLISAATVAWFLADAFYLYLSEAYADMAFNSLALVQWFLLYRAARLYVSEHTAQPEREEASGVISMPPLQATTELNKG